MANMPTLAEFAAIDVHELTKLLLVGDGRRGRCRLVFVPILSLAGILSDAPLARHRHPPLH